MSTERVEAATRRLVSLGATPEDVRAVFVPGRIEVLGKHTDYAGGRSIVCATQQGLCAVYASRPDSTLRILDLTRDLEAELPISIKLESVSDWSNYPRAVARRLARNFPSLIGADICFNSDLPRAAGMSSSSALVVMIYTVLASVNRLAERTEYGRSITSLEDLGGYLGALENGLNFGKLDGEAGVGTFGGSEDQTAILCSERGQLRQYSYCPVRHERTLAVPEDLRFAVAVSGVRAKKTGSAKQAYNRASRLSSQAAEALRAMTGLSEPHLGAFLSRAEPSAMELRKALSRYRGSIPADVLVRRFDHFRLENEEVLPAAGDALAAGDLEAFGELVDRSQKGAERLLGNQIEETAWLAQGARRLGAVAASAFGAGFGGSVWALVERDRMGEFLSAWEEGYRDAFPSRGAACQFLHTAAESGTRGLDAAGESVGA